MKNHSAAVLLGILCLIPAAAQSPIDRLTTMLRDAEAEQAFCEKEAASVNLEIKTLQAKLARPAYDKAQVMGDINKLKPQLDLWRACVSRLQGKIDGLKKELEKEFKRLSATPTKAQPHSDEELMRRLQEKARALELQVADFMKRHAAATAAVRQMEAKAAGGK